MQAQQAPTCVFNESPQTPLTNCLSIVVANLDLNENAFDFIDVYYPVQFDLSEIGSIPVNDETLLQVDNSIYTTIQVTNTSNSPPTVDNVTLKRIRFDLPFVGASQLIFNVNTCEDNFPISNANLFDTDQFPMYFDIQAFNSNSPNDPISFLFSQQVQISGSSGLIRFSALNPINAQLTTLSAFNPSYANPNAPLNSNIRNCNLSFGGTQPLPELIQFIVTSEQDVTPGRYYIPFANGSNNFLIQPNQINTVQNSNNQTVQIVNITQATLLSAGYTLIPQAGITLIQSYSQLCPNTTMNFLTTNVVATITCPGQTTCNPTNTNSITWNSVVPTTRPYSISDHNLSLISGTCNNYQYNITFNFPASDVPVLFNEISFPFAFSQNSYTNLNVTDASTGIPLISSISSTGNRLVIQINQSNLPSGFTFNQNFGGVVGNVNEFSLTINVQFTLNSSNDCPSLAFNGLSNLNTQLNFAQILFQSVCLAASQSNLDKPLPSRYNRPNTTYNLSGVCPESNLTPNTPYELDFNYVFTNTSNFKPTCFL